MAECIVLKGGGADLDAVTAGAGDVLAGKVIVGSDGEPLTGTLALSGNATAGQVLAGSTFYNTDPKNKLTGTISSLGGQTINPSASQQTVSSSGKYMTGNVVVNAVSNLAAANIKKGAVVGGVTGTFEGYVPTATDLYLRGNNVAGFQVTDTLGKIFFEAGQIYIQSANANQWLWVQRNLTGYNYVNVEVNVFSGGSPGPSIGIGVGPANSASTTNEVSTQSSAGTGSFTLSLNVSAINAVRYVKVYPVATTSCYIYRIWLS